MSLGFEADECVYIQLCCAVYIKVSTQYYLKENKTEKLHDMHVKELIQTNYFER